MVDRELLFQMLLDKKWDGIAKVMFRNPGIVQTDPIIKKAIDLFEDQFFSDTENLNSNDKLKIFEYPNLVIESNRKAFTETFVNRFVDEKLKIMHELNRDGLISYASSHQNRPLAQIILKELQQNKPEDIANSLRKNTTIKSNKIIAGVDPKTIKLFKSRQEENFFEAIRRAFPTYHPYPNVAVSCILDFEKIKNSLTQGQKEYFFKAIVDSVVFDSSKGYMPRYFIELDSSFHDSPKARENDAMKQAIFVAANVKLIRVRPENSGEASADRFHQLVLDIMRDL